METRRILVLLCTSLLTFEAALASDPLVLQSDFGLKDAAVASMKGVAVSVSRDLDIYDLTHEIPTFNIWEASLRLEQGAAYWPPGTVFVSVVDPGVGTDRKSVVLKTQAGQYFVSPDNGSLTAVAERYGIEAVREIDEAVNRLADSEQSYTFHGRDVYAYTGARLAAGIIRFEEVGRLLPRQVDRIAYQQAELTGKRIVGNIEVLDPQYGNIWTNIDRKLFRALEIQPGEEVSVSITANGKLRFSATMPYARSFGEVPVGAPLLYLNSINDVALAINQGNFSATHEVYSGPEWRIELSKKNRPSR